MKTLAMCHQAVPKSKDEIMEKGQNVSFFTSILPEEEAQLMFVS